MNPTPSYIPGTIVRSAAAPTAPVNAGITAVAIPLRWYSLSIA